MGTHPVLIEQAWITRESIFDAAQYGLA